jgi:tetratricopeptide (TPR) repeat protein
MLWLIEAQRLIQQDNWILALSILETGLLKTPNCLDGWELKSRVLQKLGRYEEAVEANNIAIVCLNAGIIDSGTSFLITADDWLNASESSLRLGRYEASIVACDQLLSIKQNDYRIWSNRGVALYELERYEEALDSYNRALAIKQDDHHAWLNQGLILFKLERYEEAVVALDQSLKLQPANREILKQRGVVLFNLKRYMDAIAVFEQVLEIEPTDYEAWHDRATTICSWYAARLPNNSTTAWEQSNSTSKHPEPHINALYEALPHLVEDSLPWAQIHLDLGNAYLEHSKDQENVTPYWREARRCFETALPVLQSSPERYLEVLQGLVRVHFLLGDFTVARIYQQRGINLFEQLRTTCHERLKFALDSEFASFSQLEIDLLVGENNSTVAIEQADFYKNRCLTQILDTWEETDLSPDYIQIQSLCKPNTAIVYWHLSIDNLTTFIITTNSNTPTILENDRLQQKQQLDAWLKSWDSHYGEYSGKKITDAIVTVESSLAYIT